MDGVAEPGSPTPPTGHQHQSGHLMCYEGRTSSRALDTDEQPPYVAAQPLANAGSSTVIFIAAEGLAQILLDVVKISVERKWVRPINRRIVIDGYQHVSTEVTCSWIPAARLHQLQPLALRHAAQSVLAFLIFVYH